MRWSWGLALLLVPFAARAETIVDPSSEFSIELDTSDACVMVPPRLTSARCGSASFDSFRQGCARMNALFCAAFPLTVTDWNLVTIVVSKPPEGRPMDPLDDLIVKEMAKGLRQPTALTPGVVAGPASISPITHDDGLDRVTISFDSHVDMNGRSRDVRDVTYVVVGRDMFMLISLVPSTSAARADTDMRRALATVRLARRPSAHDATVDRRAYWLGRLTGELMGVQVVFIAIIVLLVEPWWIARMPKTKRKRRKKKHT